MRKISYRQILYWVGVITSPLFLTTTIILTLFPFKDSEITVFVIPHFDKIAHFLSYAAVACALFLSTAFAKIEDGFKSLLLNNKVKVLLVFFISSIIGLTIEIIQPSFGRAFDLFDVLANSLGAASGIVVAILLLLYASFLDREEKISG